MLPVLLLLGAVFVSTTESDENQMSESAALSMVWFSDELVHLINVRIYSGGN